MFSCRFERDLWLLPRLSVARLAAPGPGVATLPARCHDRELQEKARRRRKK